MNFSMDYAEVLSFAFSWVNKKETWKYVFLLWAVLILLMILAAILLLGLLYAFFAPYMGNILSSSENFALGLVGYFITNPASTISFLISLLLICILLAIFAIAGFTYVNGLIYHFALREKNLSNSSFGIKKAFCLFLLGLAESLFAIFSVFNLKFLLLLGATIVGVILTFMPFPASIFGWLLAILCGLAYLAVIFYNIYRLALGGPIFMSREIGIIDSLKESWRISEGKVLEIFLAIFIVAIIMVVVSFAISFFFIILELFMPFPLNLLFTAIEWLITIPLNALITIFALVAVYKQIGKTPKEILPSGVKPVPVQDKPWLAKTNY